MARGTSHSGGSARVHSPAESVYLADGWGWREPRYLHHCRTCSYCGCVHPEDLITETGWHAEWADRKYGWPHKFYITLPVRPEFADLPDSRGSTHGPLDSPYAGDRDRYISVHDLTDDQIEVLIKTGSLRGREELERMRSETDRFHGYAFCRAGDYTLHHKFYTVHLADSEISDEVKNEIHRRSGLVFEWLDDGKVRWHPYDYGAAA